VSNHGIHCLAGGHSAPGCGGFMAGFSPVDASPGTHL